MSRRQKLQTFGILAGFLLGVTVTLLLTQPSLEKKAQAAGGKVKSPTGTAPDRYAYYPGTEELKPVFAAHGLKIREAILDEPNRHFTDALAARGEVGLDDFGAYQNNATNALSAALERIEALAAGRRQGA